MYHADTPTRTIDAYDFDGATGTPSNRRTFAHFTDETHRPDGAAVDRDGCYWTAFYGGGKVARLAPSGTVLAEYPIPAMCPTMCALGGADLKTLYVTSARQRRPDDELARLPHSGGIFAMRVDVPGIAGARVRRADRETPPITAVPFDPSAHLPLDAQESLGASASGIAFATSTGDILEVSTYGPGIFRLRVGPTTRPTTASSSAPRSRAR